ENQRREEEDRLRREEEARAKAEKEEADKKAREEAERLRHEMDEKLKKEEEERVLRRKRVEAIMLRTRQAKGGSPAGASRGVDGETDPDEGKEGSLLQESKESQSLDKEDGDKKPPMGAMSSSSSGEMLLIDTDSKLQPSAQSNGHSNQVLDYVSVDNVYVLTSLYHRKQNNATNNLLDFSEFDAFNPTNNAVLNMSQQPTMGNQQFDPFGSLTSPSSGKIANEDNVNSNVINNGSGATLIAFQDSLSKKQDSNSVADLLS
ncbi:unnamed protein product, partial [Timema podura]|nr:unnamed protein product [Timema podura]